MKTVFFLISFLYRRACWIRNLMYAANIFKCKKSPIPVLSIGNISFGGTEKTPLAIHLVSFFIKEKIRVGIISRGYKGKWENKGGVLSDGKNIYGSWEDAGDEPFMMSKTIPQAGVYIGKNRYHSCQKAAQSGFDLAILDDGFQHRQLCRDLDIVLINPLEKIALREPFISLKRADILLIKKNSGKIKEKLSHRFKKKHIYEYKVIKKGFFPMGKTIPLAENQLKNKRILVFSGIARPERFHNMLQNSGIKSYFSINFPDHHHYPLSSIKRILKKYKSIGAQAIITTEKDTVKIKEHPAFSNIPVYYLKIDLEIENNFYSDLSLFLKRKKLVDK
ncbi:MAG: tetraacyldisaccharide 4'-kinase [Candidatus Aminicenantaceae bacterium]